MVGQHGLDVFVPGDQVHLHAERVGELAHALGLPDLPKLRGRAERIAPHVQRRELRCVRSVMVRRYSRNTNSSMSLLTSGGFSSPARCATPSSTATAASGYRLGHRDGLGQRERRVLGARDDQHRRRDVREERPLVRPGGHHAVHRPGSRRRCRPPARCPARRRRRRGGWRNVVGPRNALSTDRVSGGRMPPSSFATRSRNPYSSFCRVPAGDAVQFINTALPMRSGCIAANVPPIMPPHELPTKCARSIPSPSSMSTMQLRAVGEIERRGELLALAVARRVDQDDAATVARSDRPAPPTCRRSSAGSART